MTQAVIIKKPGKINEYLHHWDLRSLGARQILSGYAAEFDDCVLFFDCGTSDDVKHLLRHAKKIKLNLSSTKYLITTHHHFDHNGGLWKLYKAIKEHNPEVKILTNHHTKELLNDYEDHLARGQRSYGDLTGIMKPIEDIAFKLIEPCENFENDLDSIDIIDSFSKDGKEVKLAILKTPGHTHDHQCPLFIKNDEIDFLFFGEAVGMLYHSTKLLTFPVSVPTYFNNEDYMKTLKKLKNLRALRGGFCHFGYVNGVENVREVITEHELFMKDFRKKVIQYHGEKDETKYICEKITSLFLPRTEFKEDHLIVQNAILSTVYGMMVDLGFREI